MAIKIILSFRCKPDVFDGAVVKKYAGSEVQLPCTKAVEPEAIDWELQRVPLQQRHENTPAPATFYNPGVLGLRPGIL